MRVLRARFASTNARKLDAEKGVIMEKGPCCYERGCESVEGSKRSETYIRYAEHLWPACTEERCLWCDCKECLWRTLQAVKRHEEYLASQIEARYPATEAIMHRCFDCGTSRAENPTLPLCDCIPF